MSLKPICVKCQRFYRPEKNGFTFLEGMPIGGAGMVEPGTSEPENWEPYKLWRGDLWMCHGCNNTIVVGVGRDNITKHDLPDFKANVELWTKDSLVDGKVFQVNDC